ncbi:MAG TPA: hypothetical protein VES42_28430 [Pilimelia sp.]|nr:hypothetical protein [Pilimelia sp.]
MTPSTLYRYAGCAGLASAAILLVNAARRADLLPETAFTHAIAPFAALLGLLAITGFYLWQREPAGLLGTIGFALNFAGLAGALAIEYAIHFFFPYLTAQTRDDLLAGPAATRLVATSAIFIVGVGTFAAAMWRAGAFPRTAIALYVVGFVPVALRAAVPLPVYLAGLVLAAGVVAWLSLILLRAPVGDRLRGRLAAGAAVA